AEASDAALAELAASGELSGLLRTTTPALPARRGWATSALPVLATTTRCARHEAWPGVGAAHASRVVTPAASLTPPRAPMLVACPPAGTVAGASAAVLPATLTP